MIEFIDESSCIHCNRCVEICPTDVFEPTGAVPQIARLDECTTCMNCELFCPTDAIWVSPLHTPEVDLDRPAILASGLMGSYARAMNWHEGRPPRGTGDNWELQLKEHQGEHPPNVKNDRDGAIRMRLYEMRDRNLITVPDPRD
jgi:NAD-dependent dihydropyrimidine dehydrogenase PreA subunit